jgi:hypothetical protein
LLVFLCRAARLATLWGRITTFLKERLISSGEGEILPAIAARNLHISGHRSPWGELYSPIRKISKGFFSKNELSGASGSPAPLPAAPGLVAAQFGDKGTGPQKSSKGA